MIITSETTDTSYWCSGSQVELDRNTDGPDTITFDISGKILTLHVGMDTLRSGAVLEMLTVAQRISGSGSQLEGSWTFSELTYRVVSGIMTAEEIAEHEKDMAMSKAFQAYMTNTVEFSRGMITTHIDGNTAAQFTAEWNGTFTHNNYYEPDSADYSVVLKTIDQYTVELKCVKSGETVRLKITPKGDRTYTSDKPEHAQHVFLTDAKTCPNLFQPEWYSEFLRDNAKSTILDGAGKRGGSHRVEKGRNSGAKRGVLPFPFL